MAGRDAGPNPNAVAVGLRAQYAYLHESELVQVHFSKLEAVIMAYSEELEARIEKIVSGWKDTNKKKMFGGVCHLLNGNMFCGVHKDFLILRLGEANSKEAMELPFVRPFDITGRPMKGWVMVESQGFGTDEALKEWLEQARKFVSAMPAK